MTDVGDDYTIETEIRVDDVLVDPSTVTLQVTSPTATVSNPTPTNPTVGVYQATVTMTEAGTWRYTWTTTGPAGIDHGRVIVAADPPDRLDPLATLDDIEETLGRDLTTTEVTQARRYLRSASTKIRAYCHGQKVTRVDNDTVKLRLHGTILRLPQRPVIAVDSVQTIGSDGQADQTLTDYAWDGLDEIDIAPANWSSGSQWGRIPDRYLVTYDHGYDVIPDTLADICADMVVRVLESPSPVEGLTTVTVGQYSEQFQQAAGAPGRAVRLTMADKRALIDAGFRRTATTTQISIR